MIIEGLINGFDMIMEMLQSGGVITYIILLLGINSFAWYLWSVNIYKKDILP